MGNIALTTLVSRRDGSQGKEFARHLDALYVAGGRPALRSLAAAAQSRTRTGEGSKRCSLPTAQRISDWKSGRNVPASFDTLRPVLAVLIAAAQSRGAATDAVVNMRRWRQLWANAQPGRDRTRSARVARTIGAEPYSREDAPWFIGRGAATACIAQMISSAAQASQDRRVIALTGASGVGKTSLLQAGLVPRISRANLPPKSVSTVILGADPTRTLATLARELRSGRVAPDATLADKTPSRVDHTVLIDQFEQIFAPTVSEQDRMRSFGLIRILSEVAVVVVCVRSSQISDCHEYSLLSEALRHRHYSLLPMTTEELRAVTRCYLGGVDDRDDGLEEALIASICGCRSYGGVHGPEPAELPILSQALHVMSSTRKSSRPLIADFRRVGGPKGVVHSLADEFWDSMSEAERTTAKRILLELVAVRGDVGLMRRRVARSDLLKTMESSGLISHVLNALTDARLVTVDQNVVYLSHDLLLTWKRLRSWVDDQYPIWHHRDPDLQQHQDRAWRYAALHPRPLR